MLRQPEELLPVRAALIQGCAFSITGKPQALIYSEVKRWDGRRGRNLSPPAAEAALGNLSLSSIICSAQLDIKAHLPFSAAAMTSRSRAQQALFWWPV